VTDLTEQPWISALLQPEAFAHDVDQLELIETHISWVILTGKFAYKIKKPIDLGFLDFSTLEKRHDCALAEVALNRPLALMFIWALSPLPATRRIRRWLAMGRFLSTR